MKTVYVGMTADIIHPGIINIVHQASLLGEVLVGLLTDSAIVAYKRLPYLSYEQRKQVVESLRDVSRIVPQEEWSYIPNLRKYRPDIIIHGDDWRTGILAKEREAVYKVMAELGGRVVEIPYTQGINSTALNESLVSIGTTPDLRLKTLRRLIGAKPVVRIMEVHSGLSGLIVEKLECPGEDGIRRFDGMWSSSLTDSTSKGKPDIEAVDITTRLQDLTQILECTVKPIIYDGDTGGIPEHFIFTVRTLERNGISAVIIEDKTGLKKNSLLGTEVEQQLAPIEEFCEKIRTGKKAQITREFMIIARLESLIAGGSVDEAMKRALAYVGAGADGIMIHSRERSGRDVEEFCRRFRKEYAGIPLVLVPTTYNQFTETELAGWGANIIIYANHLLRASYPAMFRAAESILKHGRSKEADEFCMSIREILELIPGTK
jgi:phosphoenolpyruvate phosphomutase